MSGSLILVKIPRDLFRVILQRSGGWNKSNQEKNDAHGGKHGENVFNMDYDGDIKKRERVSHKGMSFQAVLRDRAGAYDSKGSAEVRLC